MPKSKRDHRRMKKGLELREISQSKSMIEKELLRGEPISLGRISRLRVIAIGPDRISEMIVMLVEVEMSRTNDISIVFIRCIMIK